MLDVLIIGGGPHALTLATLLSHPTHFPTISRTDILEGIQLSKSKSNTRGTKNRKGAPTRKAVEELADPELPPCPPLQFKVVDSYGEWVTLWESQFRALNIPHLRSHTLVHTDPLNKKALQEFVLQHGRQKELRGLPEKVYIRDENAFFNDNRLGKRDRRRLSSNTDLQKSLYFSLPATELSVDFFKEQVHRYGLDRVLIKGTVDKILPVMTAPTEERDKTSEGCGVLFFRVLLQSGESIEAKRVVLATGPTRVQMANIPSWVAGITESYPEDRLQHTVQLMNGPRHSRQLLPGPSAVCHTGDRVMVIGGGLTSAHVITIALQQGASHVTWVMRKHLQLKQFDVGDIESLIGRYSHTEHGVKLDGLAYLRQFYNERSLHKRLSMIRQARKGGAVTPEAYALLQPSIQSGRLTVRAYCQVSDAKWCYRNQEWAISLSCNQHWTGDRIWLATGCKLDVNEDPLLADIIKEFPTQVLDGWPCVLETLQWAPGCPLYLMGQYSALQIGPHAVNLAGGQASSMRIAKDILSQHRRGGEDNAERGRARPDRTKTEEYIQQMRGLMWL